jgi:photosynthetic reaction center cytochrome c subunit
MRRRFALLTGTVTFFKRKDPAFVVRCGSLSIALMALGAFTVELSGQSSPGLQRATPPEQRAAEQVYLNIQVLKGVPAEELVLGMNAIAGSLGVDCDYCHENNFEEDRIPAKGKARQMMRMTRQINLEFSPTDASVTCFTCHQGQAIPPAMPSLLPQKATLENQQAKAAAEALPSVEQLLDRYAQALGGQEALNKIKTRVLKTAPMDPKSKEVTEIFVKAPGRVLQNYQSGGYFTHAGFNGRQAWQYDSEKSYWGLLDKGQRVSLIQESELYPGSRLRAEYTQLAILGKEKIGERDSYVLAGVSPEDAHEQFSFDAESGLLLRRRTEQISIFGTVPVQVDFEDYRLVDGVKVPFIMRWESFRSFGIGYHTVRRILEIHDNVEIPDEKFDPPAEVTARAN